MIYFQNWCFTVRCVCLYKLTTMRQLQLIILLNKIIRARAGLDLWGPYYKRRDYSYSSALWLQFWGPELKLKFGIYITAGENCDPAHCRWAWSRLAGSVAPPIVLPRFLRVHKRMKFGKHIYHEQTHKILWGWYRHSNRKSYILMCGLIFFPNPCLLWKLSPPERHSLQILWVTSSCLEDQKLVKAFGFIIPGGCDIFSFTIKHQVPQTSTYNFPSPPNCWGI